MPASFIEINDHRPIPPPEAPEAHTGCHDQSVSGRAAHATGSACKLLPPLEPEAEARAAAFFAKMGIKRREDGSEN
jgi:hypothetical protein